MADFGGLGDETDDGAGDEPQTTGQAPTVRVGLLSPSTFPLVPPDGPQPDGPTIAPQPPILSGPLDPDVHAEVLQDILDAQARLRPLAPDQAPDDPTSWDGGWLDPPAPLITGPLDADTHAEVLRDIQNAQAELPPLGSGGSSWGGPVQLPGPVTKASAATAVAGGGGRSLVGPIIDGLGALAEATEAAVALPILAGGTALFGFSDTGDHTEDARLAALRSVSESRARPGQVDPSLQTTSRSARAAIASQVAQGNMQAHHLIPAEVWGYYKNIAKLAQQAGWNQDGPGNLMALPADRDTQAALAAQGEILPVHNRSHEKYSNDVRQEIQDALGKRDEDPTPAEARKIFEEAAAMALERIRSGLYSPDMR